MTFSTVAITAAARTLTVTREFDHIDQLIFGLLTSSCVINLTSLLSLGIGYASIVIVSLLNIYYIVILAWGVYYLFQVGLELLHK